MMELPSFADIETFERQFLAPRAEALATDVDEIPLGLLDPSWVTENMPMDMDATTIISAIVGAFFRVIGVRVRAKGRETNLWTQPMITGQTEGRVALINSVGDFHYLVRAMAEPGNIGYPIAGGVNSRVLVGPSIQTSKANLEKHGSKVPLASLIHSFDATWEPAPEDGGRFFGKVNGYAVINVDKAILVERELLLEDAPNFAWVQLPVLIALRKRGLLNGHLHAALGHLL